MGVILQAFYWDCPREEKKEFKWWKYIEKQVPALAEVGFTSLWLPPIHKAANLSGPSMGYDPYDYYDLGEFDQKGSVPTWYGTKKELLSLIQTAHSHELSSDRGRGHQSQLRRGRERGQSAHRAGALDPVQTEEWKIPAQLGVLPSLHV